MGRRVFCKEHMRMCIAEWNNQYPDGKIKDWKLRCGCIVSAKDIDEIIVRQRLFLKDGTEIVNPKKYCKWELISPRGKK